MLEKHYKALENKITQQHSVTDINLRHVDPSRFLSHDPYSVKEVNKHVNDLKDRYTTARSIANKIDACKQNVGKSKD